MKREDLEKLAKNKYPIVIYDGYTNEDENKEYRDVWINGYKTAQQQLFTLDDLKEAITFGYVIGHSHGMNNKSIERPLEGKDFEEFIQSLKDGKNEKST